jgi:capsular exopolysaccharide synthesis family protein
MSDQLPSTGSTVVTTIPNALSSRPNLLALLKALRRRWVLASFAGVICAGVAASATWFLLPLKHTAQTLVQVPLDFPMILEYKREHTDLLNHQKNQVSLVKSRLVLNSILKNPKVAELSVVREQPDPLDWLERNVQADFNIAGAIMRISISGDRPQELVVLVDAVREAYLKEFIEKEQLEKTEQLTTLSQMRERYETMLGGHRKEKKELLKEGIPRHLDAQARKIHYTQQELDWNQRDLDQLNRDLRRGELDLKSLQAKEKEISSLELAENLSDPNLRSDRNAQPLLAEADRLNDQVRASTKVYVLGARDPRVRQLQQQLDAKMKELAAVRKESLLGDVRRDIVSLRVKIPVYQEERSVLEKETVRLRQRLEDLQKKTDIIQDIDEDTSALDNVLKAITAQEQALRVKITEPRRVKTLDEGYIKPPSRASRPMAAGVAGMGGLAAALLAVSFWEWRARRIETVDEVISGLGLKLVGAIPDLSNRWLVPRRGQDERQHLFVESIDTTRTMLLEGARAESAKRGDDSEFMPQVVMVTSATGGEGKTSLVTHLAASLAQIGHKTLLIDGDLRNPTAHRIIGLSGQPGCCELLRGEVELADAIRPTPIDGLFMITGGRWDNKATRALAQPRTAAILRQLRAEYEFILIDSSPVLPVVDPLLLSRHADIVLLSVLRNVSRMKNVYTACQRLTTIGVHSLRAVMSGVRGADYGSSYQYFSHADSNT